MAALQSGECDSVIGHEGPTLIDFRLACRQFELGVNGPKLLFTSLEIRTTLALQDGCDYAALRKLIDGFTVTAFCGHSEPKSLAISIAGSTVAPYVTIDVGPPSMYMSHLQFTTIRDETFDQLCQRTLNRIGQDDYLVTLVPILNKEVDHVDHHSRSHGTPRMDKTPDAFEDAESGRPKYRIEYVLNQTGSTN